MLNSDLCSHPRLLALLSQAKEDPHEDAPRLVLTDWLEDHGDPERAEFIRLQCLLAPGKEQQEGAARAEGLARCEKLQDRHGGAWLGPLWQWRLFPLEWHRGLLSLRLSRRPQPEGIEDILPWIDTTLFVIHGKQGLQRAVDFLSRMEANHVCIDLRQPVREASLLEALGQLPESRCLRSLSIDWPLGLMAWLEAGEEEPRMAPSASERFLTRLVKEYPLGRHLTHLGSSAPFSPKQALLLREMGVEPADARGSLWMHRLPASSFQRPLRPSTPTSTPDRV